MSVPLPTRTGRWGHSSGEFVVKLAQHAHVKKVALTHHDPLRSDEAIDHIVEVLKAGLLAAGSPLEIFAATEGKLIEVQPSHTQTSGQITAQFQAMTPLEPALDNRSVILSVTDPSVVRSPGRSHTR